MNKCSTFNRDLFMSIEKIAELLVLNGAVLICQFTVLFESNV